MYVFVYGNKGIASITSVHLSGAPGFGVPQLIVKVQATMQPFAMEDGPRILAVRGDLMIGNNFVASLEPQYVDWRCFPTSAEQNSIHLRAYLSHAQIRAIDDARDEKGDFTVLVALVAQTAWHDGIRPVPTTQQVPVPVNASDWGRILREMKFEYRASFEVPIEGGRVGPPLDEAAEYMRAALDKVQLHQWDDALTKCREVLDRLAKVQPAPTPSDTSKATAWDLLERVMALQASLRHVTHAGPHASIGDANKHEQEVRLVVRMTGAVLAYYAAR